MKVGGLLAAAASLCLGITSATPVYEEHIGRLANVYSGIGYAPLKDIESWSNFKDELCYSMTEGFTLDQTFFNKMSQAQAFLGVDKTNELIVLSFRGSKNVVNWVQDLYTGDISDKYARECITKDGTSLGNVHRGFCDVYTSLDTTTMAARVNELKEQHPTYMFLLTGHSLGASAASIAAAHIGLLYPKVKPVVYSIGEPRSGDIKFVNAFDQAGAVGFRLVNTADPVVHLSFCCDNCEPKEHCPYHQGTQIYYKSGMDSMNATTVTKTYTTCAEYEDPECAPMPDPINFFDHLAYFGTHTATLCTAMVNP